MFLVYVSYCRKLFRLDRAEIFSEKVISQELWLGDRPHVLHERGPECNSLLGKNLEKKEFLTWKKTLPETNISQSQLNSVEH